MNCTGCETEIAVEEIFCQGCGLDLRINPNEDKHSMGNSKHLSRSEELELSQKREFLLHEDSWVMDEFNRREVTMRETQEQFDLELDKFDPTGLSKEERSRREIELWVNAANRESALSNFRLIAEEAKRRGLIQSSRNLSWKFAIIGFLALLLLIVIL